MGRKLSCAIVDDEPLARELIRSYVDRTDCLTLSGCYESAQEALNHITKDEVDILFLDINMPAMNGIDFASMVPDRTRIVYITAYEQYALQGFRVNALDYLLKPVSYVDFMQAVSRACEWYAMKEKAVEQKPADTHVKTMITVKSGYRLVQIPLDHIQYIEVRGDRLLFFRTDGETIDSLMTMREIEDQLPDDIFMRVHRSFIVNMKQVQYVERNRIVFGKVYIPISESRKEEFFDRLTKL